MHGVPLRDSDDAVLGTWIEYALERQGKRTYTNTFFTSLAVTPDHVAEIARAGRARWKIENEGFNCLARHGYNVKRNFGHGRDGLANLLATLNLLAFALHAVLDCVVDLWRQCRDRAGTRRNFFDTLRFLTEYFCFPCWTALFETMLKKRPPPGMRSAESRSRQPSPCASTSVKSCRPPQVRAKLLHTGPPPSLTAPHALPCTIPSLPAVSAPVSQKRHFENCCSQEILLDLCRIMPYNLSRPGDLAGNGGLRGWKARSAS